MNEQPENHRDYAAVLILAALCVNNSKTRQLTPGELIALLHAVNDPIKEAAPFADADGYAIELHERLHGALPLHRMPEIVEAATRALKPFCELMNTVGEQYVYFSDEAAAPKTSIIEKVNVAVEKAADVLTAPATTTGFDNPVVAAYAEGRKAKGLPPLYPDTPQPLRPRAPREGGPNLGKDVVNEDSQ